MKKRRDPMSSHPHLNPRGTFDASDFKRQVGLLKSEDGDERTNAISLDSWHLYFTRITVPGDGNCLFSSVAKILSRLPEEQQAVIDAHLKSKGVRAVTCEILNDPDMLRVLSIASVFRYSTVPQIKEMINLWRYHYAMALRENDRELMTEYRHVDCLTGIDEETLTRPHLDLLYQAMRSKSSYWGNEFDLRMLEEFLGVHFIILSNEGKVSFVIPEQAPSGFEPNIFCLLYRRHLPGTLPHFEGLKYKANDKLSFFPDELPPEVIDMCQRDIQSRDGELPWWVTLRDIPKK